MFGVISFVLFSSMDPKSLSRFEKALPGLIVGGCVSALFLLALYANNWNISQTLIVLLSD